MHSASTQQDVAVQNEIVDFLLLLLRTEDDARDPLSNPVFGLEQTLRQGKNLFEIVQMCDGEAFLLNGSGLKIVVSLKERTINIYGSHVDDYNHYLGAVSVKVRKERNYQYIRITIEA